MKELIAAGAHFGHQTQKWDPRMQPYIFGKRAGIHIINLEHTVPMLERACQALAGIVAQGGDVLFVGTKRQAQLVIADEAVRCKMHYVNNRWLGGTLTNFGTIKTSINRLKDLETKMGDGSFDALTKKERRMIEREIVKLHKALGGIKDMAGLPAALFIIDPKKEAIAQREANKLRIPVIAIIDTNCNPEHIDFPIPGNDDAIKAIRVFTHHMAEACLKGLEKRQVKIREEVAQAASRQAAQEEGAPKRVEVVTERARAYVADKPAEKKSRRGKSKKEQTATAKAESEPKNEEPKATSAQSARDGGGSSGSADGGGDASPKNDA